LKRKAESGFSIAIQSIYYVSLLFIFFGLIFDLGNAGYVYTIASNAARMAAQDAAKNIDEQAFLDEQEIRLSDGAMARAQAIVSGMTDDKVAVTQLSINHLSSRDVIVVKVMAVADMPILGSVMGLSPITIRVDAYAEPASGISEEGQ